MKPFLKKNWSNLLFFTIIALLIIPQTRMPIQVFVQRLISFSPSEISEDKQQVLSDYNWELASVNQGLIQNLSVSEEKVTLINFWATWCPPCVAEMPSLQNLYNTYGSEVDFYFVTNETSEVIEKFLAKNEYSFPVYQYSSNPSEKLKIKGLPTTFVISKEGKIIMREVGAADWDSDKVRNLLDDLLKE